MKIRLGIKSDLINRFHSSVQILSTNELTIEYDRKEEKLLPNNRFIIAGKGPSIFEKTLTIKNPHNSIINLNLTSSSSKTNANYSFVGDIEISRVNNQLTAIAIMDLETYTQFVLSSELPEGYNIEAKKAQAIIVRTYALNPRVDHRQDGFLVCSSYLCCQAFQTHKNSINRTKQITEVTKGQILTYENKPILAMFSANAGGHTENFENCFSDFKTGAFPAKPLPYLKGVAEGDLPNGFPDETALKELYYCKNPKTKDAWSNSFRWQLKIKADSLEAHMHHVIKTLKSNEQFSAFIQGPELNTFGHIQKFEITKRGVSGTAMYMNIHTSHGIWKVMKELTIRQVFANSDIKLKRLRSARIIFEHKYDSLGLLKELNILGLGTGHGVGLQQDGAQGFAKSGFNYKQILSHYYPKTVITTIK
jgi:SpoIID/LytB domain protein